MRVFHASFIIFRKSDERCRLQYCCLFCLQDPSKADAMTRLQKDLDETKVIMVRKIMNGLGGGGGGTLEAELG